MNWHEKAARYPHLHHIESCLVVHQSHAGVGHEAVEALPQVGPWGVGHDPQLRDGCVISLSVHGV